GGAPGRQVPDRDLRPQLERRRRRARLQEPAAGRARLPRPEGPDRAAPRLPPPRPADPRARARLLPRAPPRPRLRDAHQSELARAAPRAAAGQARPFLEQRWPRSPAPRS